MFNPGIAVRPNQRSRRGGAASLAPPSSPPNLFLSTERGDICGAVGGNSNQQYNLIKEDECHSPHMVFDSPRASPVSSPAQPYPRGGIDMFKTEPMSPLNLESTSRGPSSYGMDGYSERKIKTGESSRNLEWRSDDMVSPGTSMHSTTPSPSDASIMSVTSPMSPSSNASSPYPSANSPASRLGKLMIMFFCTRS